LVVLFPSFKISILSVKLILSKAILFSKTKKKKPRRERDPDKVITIPIIVLTTRLSASFGLKGVKNNRIKEMGIITNPDNIAK
jgi:hypothetical protein